MIFSKFLDFFRFFQDFWNFLDFFLDFFGLFYKFLRIFSPFRGFWIFFFQIFWIFFSGFSGFFPIFLGCTKTFSSGQPLAKNIKQIVKCYRCYQTLIIIYKMYYKWENKIKNRQKIALTYLYCPAADF